MNKKIDLTDEGWDEAYFIESILVIKHLTISMGDKVLLELSEQKKLPIDNVEYVNNSHIVASRGTLNIAIGSLVKKGLIVFI